MRDAIWITGVGMGTPYGFAPSNFTDQIFAGRSAVTKVDAFDASRHRSQIAAALGPIPVPSGRDDGAFSKLRPLEQLALWCAEAALADADYPHRDERLGVIFGSGAEWLQYWERDASGGGNLVQSPRADVDCTLHFLRQAIQSTGPALSIGAACASGNYAFGIAKRWIQMGLTDACLVGSCDRSLTPIGLACFDNLGALSARNDEPVLASRPFDRGRNGFVLGEGGAMFVVEAASSARRRGARPYAELAGFGATGDAHHIVAPCPEPTQASRAIRLALADAQLNHQEVDYINAHATSTPLGDVAEAKALRDVFGQNHSQVPVSATKSMTGHLLGGASAIEAVACIAAIQHGVLPPTINLDDPDPECDLCHVGPDAWQRRVDVAVSNAFGFGGMNSCVVFRRAA